MKKLPNRHRNHEIENLSEIFLKNHIPSSWIINSFKVDYGTDYNCEISTNNEVTGNNFSIQLKGKENETNSKSIKVKLKKTTINRWLNRLEPTMLVAYVIDEKEAFWMWFEDNTVDLTLENKIYSISIPRTNKLSELNWVNVSKYIDKIFSKRHLLYDTPLINNQNKEAWKAFFNYQYEKALSFFYELIKKDNSNDSLVFEAIAISEYQLFNYQKALININKSLEIENNNNLILTKASILTELGLVNDNIELVKKAIKLFEALILKNEVSYELYYNFGSALTKLNQYEKSIKYFELAISLNPNKPEVWNNLANAFMHLQIFELQISCYNKALQINPNLPEALFSKGSSLFRYFGKTEEGLKLMLQAVEKSNRHEIDNPNVFFWIAEAYLSQKDFKNALSWNNKGLLFFPINNFLNTQKSRITNKKIINTKN